MLTLKEPIKLNIADGLTTVSDAFYERICGNYGMLTASITPKELLFFLSAPPELPEDLGGMTTFAIQNNVTDNRAITMDVINNVVNRILLSQTNDFTYQDQVYIDNVLRKLGVTDVNLFMKQVQKLQSEQTDLHQLLRLYRQETHLRAAAPLPEERGSKAEPSLSGSSEAPSAPPARYYLHNDIYARLETKAIYDTVNAFQQEQSHFFGSLQKNELRTAEQLFVSNMLSLSQLRSQTLQNNQLSLTHAVNHFELGDLLPAPATEEQVLSQAAAAALVSTVEHVLVQKLSRQGDSKLWLSLENSLSETIENTIARFQSYHSGDAVYLTPEADISIETNNSYKTESSSLQKLITLRQEYAEAARESVSLMEAMGAPELTFPQPPASPEGESVTQGDSFYSASSTTRLEAGDTIINPAPKPYEADVARQLEAAVSQAQAAGQTLKTSKELRLEYDLREQNELFKETVINERSSFEPETEETPARPHSAAPAPELIEALSQHTAPSAPAQPAGGDSYYSAQTTNIDNSSTQLLPGEEPGREPGGEQAAAQQPTPPALTHPVSDTQAPPELIAQELEEISHRNRERFQQLQGLRAQKTAQSVPTPDVQRTMSDALRSLESPEAVLREVLGAEPADLSHPQPRLSPEASAYLSGADETTRNLLETVMRMETGSGSPAGAATIRQASLGELNAAATIHPPHPEEPEAEAQRLEHESMQLTQRADTLLEQYSEAPAHRAVKSTPASPLPKAAIVHRQEQNTFSDELLELINQQHSRENVTTTVSENVTNRQTRELTENEVTNQVVTQSTEDITQLVNRAISKQMGTISDKVYHQMEKRLQTERSRRGRL